MKTTHTTLSRFKPLTITLICWALIASACSEGSNPDADSLLEVVDFHIINSRPGISITRDYESRLTDERPFFEDVLREADFLTHPVAANDSVSIDCERHTFT